MVEQVFLPVAKVWSMPIADTPYTSTVGEERGPKGREHFLYKLLSCHKI